MAHWADEIADQIIQQHPNQDVYTVASGASPSGILHMGNLREILTPFFVVKALRDKGKKVRFIFSLDNYDRLRKVSTDIQTIAPEFYKNIGRPYTACEDPFGCHASYAEHFEQQFLKSLDKLGVELEDVSFEEFRSEIDSAKDVVDPIVFEPLLKEKVSRETLVGALRIYSALRNIIIKHNLNGVTVRCFDLLGTLHNTSCLALAMLNKDGYIATCEGDVPTMLTMALVKKLTHQSSFQVNPSYINVKERYAYFAHCTLPLDMCLSYKFDTHFESGIGLGIAGRLNLGKVTVLKVNKDWSKFQAFDGKITANLGRNDLCRTQVKVEFDEDISSLLCDPLGNHIVICYGAHKKEIEDLLK